MEPTRLSLLLVEDNPGDARLLAEMLRDVPSAGFEVVVAGRLSEALERLGRGRFDLVLTDLSLPDSRGLEAFHALHAAAPATPVVVLSGVDDETQAVHAVREGAQDYLVKGSLNPPLLSRALRYAIERHRTEERLSSQEAFYHSLVEHIPQSMFRKDLQERFTFANQRFCQALGKTLPEIMGRTDFDFYPESLAAKYQEDDRRVIRTGETLETTEENVSPTGEKIYVQVVKTPIRDARGAILGTQCIFWDVTERKRFEEQLQQKNLALASSAEALRRSHEELKSAQLQLIQAEKMESVGTLAAGVAHEVKNPLAILQMGLTYLRGRVPAEPNNTLVLDEMQDAIQRADNITRGLLNFAANQSLNVQPADLNLIIQDSLRLLRHELSTAQVKPELDLAAHLPAVAVDRMQIQQVLLNVLLNAVHAMPGGGFLRVRTFVREAAETSHVEGSRSASRLWRGERIVVAEIDDSGTGIPEANLARIFDPFFTTKPTGKGTGLGLPVSKKIIDLHGGTIDVRNRSDGGVRVTLSFKATKPAP